MGKYITIDEAFKQTKQELGIAGGLVEEKLVEYARTHQEFAELRAEGSRLSIERAGILAVTYNRQFEHDIQEIGNNGLEGIAQARTIRAARNKFNDIMNGPTLLERLVTEPYKDEDGLRLAGFAGAGAAFLASVKMLWNKPMGMLKKAGLVLAATLGGGALTTLIPWVKDKILGADEAAGQEPSAPAAPSPATSEQEPYLEARNKGAENGQTLTSTQAPVDATTLTSAQDAAHSIRGLNESTRRQAEDAVAAIRPSSRTLAQNQSTALDLPPQYPVIEGIRVPNPSPSYAQIIATNQQNTYRNYYNAYPNRFGNMQFNANAPNPYYGPQLNGRVPYSDAYFQGSYAGLLQNVYGAGNYNNRGMTPNMLAGFEPQYNFGTYVPHNTGMIDYKEGSRGLLSHVNEAELPNFPSTIGGGNRLTMENPQHGLAMNAKAAPAAIHQPRQQTL